MLMSAPDSGFLRRFHRPRPRSYQAGVFVARMLAGFVIGFALAQLWRYGGDPRPEPVRQMSDPIRRMVDALIGDLSGAVVAVAYAIGGLYLDKRPPHPASTAP